MERPLEGADFEVITRLFRQEIESLVAVHEEALNRAKHVQELYSELKAREK